MRRFEEWKQSAETKGFKFRVASEQGNGELDLRVIATNINFEKFKLRGRKETKWSKQA